MNHRNDGGFILDSRRCHTAYRPAGTIGSSALGKSDPCPLTKTDPHEEHDWEHDFAAGQKRASDIIHAEGVRFAFPSSAPTCVRLPVSTRPIVRVVKASDWIGAAARVLTEFAPRQKRALAGGKTHPIDRGVGSLLVSKVGSFLASAE